MDIQSVEGLDSFNMKLQFLRGSVGNREQYCYPWLVISAPCRSEPYRAGARGFRGFRVFTYFPFFLPP
jgi:hypothetical protein